jgi:UDP-glucose 4-epimerase
LAASIEVEESINNPIKYYENNVIGSFNIIKKCIEYNVKNLIFASSAAVYGNPKYIPIMERDPLSPINPYGTTKMIVEKMIQEICPKYNINYTILRFFNVAGADIDGKIGQDYKNSTHLITRALKTAKGEFDKLTIFGND